MIRNSNRLNKLGNIYPKNGQAGFVYDSRYLSPTLVTFIGGGGKEPIVFIKVRKI